MSLNASATYDGTDLETRDVRALTECMTVLLDDYDDAARDTYVVVSESGSEYHVDAATETCTCPDHIESDERCKHLRRVAFATGERVIPEWVDVEEVDDLLGAQIDDGGPRVAATDGGVTQTTQGDASNASDVDDKCDECDALAGEFPCADCYIHGDAELPNADK